MERKQTGIGKVIAQALILLLLCGIVGGEFPELLSLTDNASNDFTVSKKKPSSYALSRTLAGMFEPRIWTSIVLRPRYVLRT